MQYKTLGDFFNPGQALMQAEQLRAQQQQRQQQQEMAPYKLQMARLQPQQVALQIEQAKHNMAQPKVGSVMDDKTFTEKDAIKLLTFGSPEQKKQAEAFLDNYTNFQKRMTTTRYGELDPSSKEFYAEKILVDPSYITKFPARSPQRAELANEVNRLASERGLKVPDLELKNKKFNATVKSYNHQKKTYDADQKLADEFFTDVNRVKTQIQNLRTNYPSYVNLSIKKLRELSAAGKLGPEAVLQQELDAIMQTYSRMTLDASASISELSVGAQERYRKLLNSNSPAFVLLQQLENFEKALNDRLGARGRSLVNLENQLKTFSDFKEKKESKEQTKKMVFNPGTGRFE